MPSPAPAAPGPPTPNHGLFRNRLFNDDASRNRAELEPIDRLTRSTTPRSGHVAIALGGLAVAVATWLLLGSIDHSLWLSGRLLDTQHSGAPRNPIQLETEVRLSDAQHLTLGRRIFVFRNGAAGTFLTGTIRGVHIGQPRGNPERPAATLRLDIEQDPSSGFLPSGLAEDYRLRIPVGSQRPIELLLGLASPRPARQP